MSLLGFFLMTTGVIITEVTLLIMVIMLLSVLVDTLFMTVPLISDKSLVITVGICTKVILIFHFANEIETEEDEKLLCKVQAKIKLEVDYDVQLENSISQSQLHTTFTGMFAFCNYSCCACI